MTTQLGGHVVTADWRTVLSVFKLRIGVLIMLSALAGLAIAPAPAPDGWRIAIMAFAVLLASASAGAFNQLVEARSDRLMARTRRRAFASGALRAGPAWFALIVLLLAIAVALTWTTINGVSALYLFLGAFTYAVVYTLGLKRRTWTNIVFGGLAGSFAVLTGASAADPTVGNLPLLLALVLFLWTPPHFWSLAIANHEEYRVAGIPMLPVVVGVERAARVVYWNTVLLVAVSLLPIWFGAGPGYLVGAVIGGAWFIYRTGVLARHPTSRSAAMAAFFASMLQLTLLIVGVGIDAALE